MSEYGTFNYLSDSDGDVEIVPPPKSVRVFGVYNDFEGKIAV